MQRIHLHRWLLGAVILGNTVLFAGIDPITRALTALLALALVLEMRRPPEVPPVHRLAGLGLAALLALQLVPLPAAVRGLLQPGFAELFHQGWAPLSLAPWATLQCAASIAVVVAVALAAARLAATRTGLPTLIGIIAASGALLAVLGLSGEAGGPERVMLVRDNLAGGGPYGPFANRNHFALALELALPAALVLLAAAWRHLRQDGSARRNSVVLCLAGGVTLAIGGAAMLRCGSRGGVVFMTAALVLTLPLWLRRGAGTRWPFAVLLLVIVAGVTTFAWTRLPELNERFRRMMLVEGSEGAERQDFWSATLASWRRAPLVGSGLGSYRHVISVDKPATEGDVLEQAHNDWLEWASTSGLAGVAVLLLGVAGLAAALWPSRVRRLRFEYRYPLAGAALALTAAALHEVVDFGLQTPLNRFLLAAWVGLVWGLRADIDERRRSPEPRPELAAEPATPAEAPDIDQL